MARLVYGRSANELRSDQLPVLGSDSVRGGYLIVADRWGEAIEWSGERTD
jgi:hypothetical protein